MRLARSSLMYALTGLASRNAEAWNIGIVVGATFVKPNRIAAACKQQRTTTPVCRTSAQATGFNERQIFARWNRRSCADEL